MKTYIGTKIVKAELVSKERFEAKKFGGEVAEGVTFGYLVRYEDGYESWSPKEVFERCYREVTSDEKALI